MTVKVTSLNRRYSRPIPVYVHQIANRYASIQQVNLQRKLGRWNYFHAMWQNYSIAHELHAFRFIVGQQERGLSGFQRCIYINAVVEPQNQAAVVTKSAK